VRLSSEILPVMSIVTLCFVMFFIKGTPFSLKVEHIEVSIFLHEMNNSCLYVSHRMSKGAIVSVFTVVEILREFRAELGLVFLDVIQPFNFIVS
jgi:hypothetical protein